MRHIRRAAPWVVFFAALFAITQYISAGRDAETQIRGLLLSAGFREAVLTEPQKKSGALVYQNIALDPNAFSTIKSLSVRTDWLGNVREIEIDGLDLTGELQDNLYIAIAGWQKSHLHPPPRALLGARPAITLNDARLSLLNPEIGGLEIRLDLQLRPNSGDNDYEFDARLKGAQTRLNFNAAARGTITPHGYWQSAIDVEQAKFALGPMKGSRISGALQASGSFSGESQILGELQAGGLSILGLPWENATLTLDGSLENTHMIVTANSPAGEGLEFSLTLSSLQSPDIYSGTLHADFLGQLFDYLNRKNALFMDRALLTPLEMTENIDAEFKGTSTTFAFTVLQDNSPIITSGIIKAADETASLEGISNGLPFTLELEDPAGALRGTLALSQDGRSLVMLPDGKPLAPQLDETSEMMDIFRDKNAKSLRDNRSYRTSP